MLLQIDGSTDVVVRDITMLDSPRFNLYLGSYCKRVLVERVTILADWQAQENLQKSVPMFPFNTDGIDVAGEDITIRDIVVSNYDDVVAVKTADLLPSSADGVVPGCTRNITVSNATVYRGAGLSVGSVHPSPLKPCVRDVVFEKATLWSPLKGPYVKPDRATPECLHLDHDACSASIQNVTYKHVRPARSLSRERTDTPTPSPRLAFRRRHARLLRRRRGAPWLGPVRELPPRESTRARRTLRLPAHGRRTAPPGDLVEEDEVRRPRLSVHDVAALPRPSATTGAQRQGERPLGGPRAARRRERCIIY